MRNRFIALCTALLFIASFALVTAIPSRPAAAQDTEPVVCDSTLVLLVYIAEHDYGFQPMLDVSTLEKGQYAPLFEAMMSMTDGAESTAEAMMESTPEMMGTESMGDEMMATLAPGDVAGEPELCTQLRGEVEAFLFSEFEQGMMQ